MTAIENLRAMKLQLEHQLNESPSEGVDEIALGFLEKESRGQPTVRT